MLEPQNIHELKHLHISHTTLPKNGESHIVIWFNTWPNKGVIRINSSKKIIMNFCKLIETHYTDDEVKKILCQGANIDLYRQSNLFVFGDPYESGRRMSLKQFFNIILSYSWG